MLAFCFVSCFCCFPVHCFRFTASNIVYFRMFWNLVVVKYEKYQLHHVAFFTALMLYSYVGAVLFCAFEQGNEMVEAEATSRQQVQLSISAKKQLVSAFQACVKCNYYIKRESLIAKNAN